MSGTLYIVGTPEDGYRIGQYVQVHITAAVDDYDLSGEVTLR